MAEEFSQAYLDFMALSDEIPLEERAKAYEKLSSHDKFLYRVSGPIGLKSIGHVEPTEEERKQHREQFREILTLCGVIKPGEPFSDEASE